MLETIAFLAAPMTACVLLAGILGYFGNHILSRGIIFIDIAIAQTAALGTMLGLLLGFAEGSYSVEVVSLIFTLLVVIIFSLTKFEKQTIPQEAIIGIIYGLALGLAMFFAENIPGGSNFITKTITGNILWVTWNNVLTDFIIFLVVGIIHFAARKHITQISDSKHRLPFSLQKVRWFELLFYGTFAVVIVRAVLVGGIFLVFILLIAPTSMVTLFTRRWKPRLVWSWIIGIAGSIGGMLLSYSMNISNGPAIVALLGTGVFVCALVVAAVRKNSDARIPVSNGGVR